MSINFATLQSLTIPEGVVTQIADASGRVLWSAIKLYEDRAVLTVAKQTGTTYAGSTSYENESFILLDIYPQKGGTVRVTYGGLTKTVKDSGTSANPNAKQVYFGTFNGISDSVSTPDSGTLTIEGNFTAYAAGVYQNGSKATNKSYCGCITNVVEFGEYLTELPLNMFRECKSLTTISLPNSITSVSDYAFYNCTGLAIKSLPNWITHIGDHAFYNCNAINSVQNNEFVLSSNLISIGDSAFSNCYGLKWFTIPTSVTSIGEGAFMTTGASSVVFENTSGWYVTQTEGGDISTGTAVDVSNASNNATMLTNTYCSGWYWYRI